MSTQTRIGRECREKGQEHALAPDSAALAGIREALVDLHTEGYKIDPGAWELAG